MLCSTPPHCVSSRPPHVHLATRTSILPPTEGAGAAWTRRGQGSTLEIGRLYHSEQEALVGELVALLELHAAEPERKWRGGPFLPCELSNWPPDLIALWDALKQVQHSISAYRLTSPMTLTSSLLAILMSRLPRGLSALKIRW